MHIHYLEDHSHLELPEGSTAKDLADKLNLKGPHEALGASINGKTVDLSHPLHEGDKVKIWNLHSVKKILETISLQEVLNIQ